MDEGGRREQGVGFPGVFQLRLSESALCCCATCPSNSISKAALLYKSSAAFAPGSTEIPLGGFGTVERDEGYLDAGTEVGSDFLACPGGSDVRRALTLVSMSCVERA